MKKNRLKDKQKKLLDLLNGLNNDITSVVLDRNAKISQLNNEVSKLLGSKEEGDSLLDSLRREYESKIDTLRSEGIKLSAELGQIIEELTTKEAGA